VIIPISRPVLGNEELAAVAEVFSSGWLGLGAVTAAFEEDLQILLGCEHVVCVNSGTAALHIALAGFGIGRGDEVLVPSITFAATVQAILATGATPVFCDSLEETILIDPDDVARRITTSTKAILPVHLRGTCCRMDALLELAERYQCVVIEDAAHAFGSRWQGRTIGSFGHATCFSFDPIKTITCGEGGAVAVHDGEAAKRMRRLRNLGFDDVPAVEDLALAGFRGVICEGFRAHMPNFCAAIGRVQLRKLDHFIARRRELCRCYDAAFADLATVHIQPTDYDEVVPHLYVVRVAQERRQDFTQALSERGIGTGLHYVANHLHPYFRRFVTAPLPVASRLWRTLVTLPLHCGMSDAEQEHVIQAVREHDRNECL
jgi:dTDP-4-amino-4,6-dideoxygalactose transaminase